MPFVRERLETLSTHSWLSSHHESDTAGWVQNMKIVTFFLATDWKCRLRCISSIAFPSALADEVPGMRWQANNLLEPPSAAKRIAQVTTIFRAITSNALLQQVRRVRCSWIVRWILTRHFFSSFPPLSCITFLSKKIKEIKEANLSWCLTFILSLVRCKTFFPVSA